MIVKKYPTQLDPKILNMGQTNGWHMHYKNKLQENVMTDSREMRASDRVTGNGEWESGN